MNNSLVSKIYFSQCLFFSKIIHFCLLLIRCYKTNFFLWNTNNTDRNGVNKQNTHTHTHTHTLNTQGKITLEKVSSYENKWYPPFLKKNTPIYFFNPSIFIGKIWTPLFSKILKTHPLCPFIKGEREGGFQLCFSFFKLRKQYLQIGKLLLHFVYKKQIILAT